jgi:hypothetical protein
MEVNIEEVLKKIKDTEAELSFLIGGLCSVSRKGYLLMDKRKEAITSLNGNALIYELAVLVNEEKKEYDYILELHTSFNQIRSKLKNLHDDIIKVKEQK